jgi:hypothetical protein
MMKKDLKKKMIMDSRAEVTRAKGVQEQGRCNRVVMMMKIILMTKIIMRMKTNLKLTGPMLIQKAKKIMVRNAGDVHAVALAA